MATPNHDHIAPLHGRDLLVFTGIALGLTRAQIASSLHVTTATVDGSSKRLREAYGERNTAYLMVKLISQGLLRLLSNDDELRATFGQKVAARARKVRERISARVLDEKSLSYLRQSALRYPQIEKAWTAALSPIESQVIRAKAGISALSVSGPFMLVLATCAQLGIIRPTDLPDRSEPTTFTVTLGDGRHITVLAPADVAFTLEAEGTTHQWSNA